MIPGIGFQQAGWLAQEPEFIDDVERNLDTGRFQWMGELLLRHYGVPELDAGSYDFSPDTDLFRRVLDLSARYRVPLTVHHESDQETRELFKEVLIGHPEAIVVWAHWCGRSTADEAREFLEQLPNLHCDTGASGVSRRYGREKNPLFVSQLVWDPDWRDLIEEMPDRFLFAVDAVVAVHYAKYGNLIKEYPQAFEALSDEVRSLILGGNALRLMSSVVSPFEAPTTTTGAPEELAAICTFDESVPKISCQAVGTTQGSQLRWESNVYGWKTGTSYEVELVEQHQLVPEAIVMLQECQGPVCVTAETRIDTSALVPSASSGSTQEGVDSNGTAQSSTTTTTISPTTSTSAPLVRWNTNSEKEWAPSTDPPPCEPFGEVFSVFPIATNLLTQFARPGRTGYANADGTEPIYIAHGALRADNSQYDQINVRFPAKGFSLYAANRRVEETISNEEQVKLLFHHPCGIQVWIDHLAKPTDKWASVIEDVPVTTSSRITFMPAGAHQVEAGEVLASGIGHDNNTYLDFGVYDLRNKNDVAEMITNEWPDYRSTGDYAICWSTFFGPDTQQLLEALPAGAVDTSDYCDG